MRIGQHVSWVSLSGSGRVFSGSVRMFEHDPNGWAAVAPDDGSDWALVRRKRLVIATPPAKKTAKGGGDDSAPSGVLIAEAA